MKILMLCLILFPFSGYTQSLVQIQKAHNLARKGKHEKAIKVLKECLLTDSLNAEIYVELAKQEMYLDDNAGLDELNKAVELDSMNFWGRYYRANQYFRFQQYELALEDFEKLYSQSPTNHILMSIATSKILLNRYDEAQSDLDLVIVSNDENELGHAFDLKGNIYFQTENYEMAVLYYKESLMYPWMPLTYLSLAKALHMNRKSSEAVEVLDECRRKYDCKEWDMCQDIDEAIKEYSK